MADKNFTRNPRRCDRWRAGPELMQTSKMTRPRTRTEDTRRRWCIPSALLRSPGEKLNGIAILEEMPDSVGLLLWLTLDDVTLWATSPPKTRPRLLGLCSPQRLAVLSDEAPTDLRCALEFLSAILALPGDADEDMMGRACLAIAAWARGRSQPRTALAFAQAGALAAPMLPEAALQTAISAQVLREGARAETWLRRTIAVARRAGDWSTYGSAYALLGKLQFDQGQHAEAEESLRIAFRTAGRIGIPLVRRNAAHGFFQLALARARATDDPAARDRFLVEADTHAHDAYRAQRAEQPGSVPLLLDLARHWIMRGDAVQALGALNRLRTVGELTPGDTLAIAAITARAAAAARRPKLSKTADERASQMLYDQSITENAAFAAAVDLAHAAVDRCDHTSFDRARSAALRFAPEVEYPRIIKTLDSLARAWKPLEGDGAEAGQ
ncbi:hypothetical protein [Longimicrobium sp.]|uniref:hypothetical protein n=1 Tax=Longimicrobium sp. TaxID=2029185 RepID=UPI002E3287F8|nr:hypothetical protein [Longimicrobium sp.]HEX6042827.1 hypothetical protein [Longimicrobium sp.]